tara:strand:+ start:1022 stop:1339 length:318 start_codon:yes stop_codon:yes gene_type:complete
MATGTISNTYYGLNILFITLYVLSFIDYDDSSYYHLELLNEFYKIFIGFVLFYFFNPLYEKKINNIHKSIAFSAGLLLLITSSLSVIIKNIPFVRKIPYVDKFNV